MSQSIKIISALVAVGLLSAACSSSASGGGSTKPPSKATLKGIVLKQSDLPSGWTGKPATDDSKQDSDIDSKLAACVGSSNSGDKDQVQKVSSDDFTKGQSTVSSDVTSYKTAAAVQNQVAQLKNSKAQSCLNSLFKTEIMSSLPSTATIKTVGITLDTSDTGISNLAGTATGKISIGVQGQTVTIYISAGFFTGNQLTGEVTFSSIGTPISSSFSNPLVKTVTKRAASA